MYHEQQSLYRCGLHALNNLLQYRAFERADLDAICEQLAQNTACHVPSSWSSRALSLNPHRAPFALGNYDVNVLICALQSKGLMVEWYDKRKQTTAQVLCDDTVKGVLCNVVTSNALSWIMEQRHWFAIRKMDDATFHNLDSKLPAPMPFESTDACAAFLQELLDTGECELLIVKTQHPNA